MRNWLLLSCCLTIFLNTGNLSAVKLRTAVMGRSHFSNGFFLRRAVSINQRACSCPTASTCSCCQSVTILLRRVAQNFCVNFSYVQTTGLTMNILLGSNNIRQVSIRDYRAFKVCILIPDCFHSYACVDVVELSLFPRSITICIRLQITSKTENWLINYNCISIATSPTNQNLAGNPPGQLPPGQLPAAQLPAGQLPAGQLPPGQLPAGQLPAEQLPAGQLPAGQLPAGQLPAGQLPAGQLPPGQLPAGQLPPGQFPAGQLPPGQLPAGQLPPGQSPAGQLPPGQLPAGQLPPGQLPAGQLPPGQMFPGQFPQGQIPQGPLLPAQMLPGQLPPRLLPPGQLVPRQTRMLNYARCQKPILGKTKRIPRFSNWVLLRKARGIRSRVEIIEKRPSTRGSKSAGKSNSAINETSRDILKDEHGMLGDQKVKTGCYFAMFNVESRDNFDKREFIRKDKNQPNKFNRRTRRNIHEESKSPAMKMQVILRSKKTRLPKIVGNNLTKKFEISVNHPASRSSRIVNQDTISNPMSGVGSSSNALTPQSNQSQIESVTPQQIPESPPYRSPMSPPVLVLENSPSTERSFTQGFFINYDNRTSSFPDRMPPSFGIASRIGPVNENTSKQFIDRSVEELETVGPRIQLLPNSKFIEFPTTPFSDGRIIFPE